MGVCFVELGTAGIACVQADMRASPPAVVWGAPSAERRADKEEWVRERLTRWFR